MSSQNRHIIQKQVFDLTLRESKDSFTIQQKISTASKERLTPLLNDLFDQLVSESDLVQIDHLEIDIGSISPEELERQLPEKIAAAIQQKIENLLERKSPELQRHPLNVSQFEAWLSYLEKGYLPWRLEGYEEESIQESVLESLAAYPASLQKFKSLIRRNPIAMERLIRQSGEDFLLSLLQACIGKKQTINQQFREELGAILASLTNKKSILLFGTEKINKRTYFIAFWRQAILLSVEKEAYPEPSSLVVAVLKSIPQQNNKTPELAFILNTIQNKEAPLRVLATAFSKIEEPESYPAKQVIEPDKEVEESRQAREQKEESNTGKSKQETIEKDHPGKNQDEILDAIKEESAPPKVEREEAENNAKEEVAFQETKTHQDLPEDIGIKKEKEGYKDLDKQDNEQDKTTMDQATGDKTSVPQNKDRPYLDARLESLTEAADGSEYYIQNAGIIILHPFLKTYFVKNDLLAEDRFKDTKAQERAVHLLQYLSSGQDMQAEYHLLFNKFLCGLPLNFPIDREVKITDPEKKEGDHLLQTIINHWGALGNVGPNSIREGFFQREGKLEKRTGNWHLQVERKTIDILLGKLPWGIGMIKLPWVEEMLTVEWY